MDKLSQAQKEMVSLVLLIAIFQHSQHIMIKVSVLITQLAPIYLQVIGFFFNQ